MSHHLVPRRVRKAPVATLVVVAAAAAGCGAPDGDRAGAAYVVFDAAARASGLGLLDDGELVPAGRLPIEIDAPAVTELVRVAPGAAPGGGSRRGSLTPVARLELASGEVVQVRGSDAELRRGAADPDRLRVTGGESGVKAFAELFGAWPVREGDADTELGAAERWVISSPDVLSLAASLDDEDVEGVLGVQPIYTSDEALRDQEADLERQDDEHWAMATEVAAIERDLAVLVGIDGGTVIEVGRALQLRAELVNRSARPRVVVVPGDGSSVGWREPYVRWSAEREVQPGVWESVAPQAYSRCGHYDADWKKDARMLAPGESILLDNFAAPEHALDLWHPGNYRVRAHYEYRAGVSGRGALGLGLGMVETPTVLEGVPAFEVVSAPVEVRLERRLELVLQARRPAVRVGGGTRPGDVLELTLVNRSGTAVALPAGPEGIDLHPQGTGYWPEEWWRARPVWPRGTLAPGASVRVELEGSPAGAGADPAGRQGPARVRAAAWLRDRAELGSDGVELRSNEVALDLE